ncbi:uncharacterized protein LOC110622088 isoform X2 [Manihot esculenta]|uniref:Uncharacterized protein n=3 Tax=Manihot esculenta TaxID=3983 RepID=A0A251K309_MANES|nr:uncharacterized protein LOC110622088 isoform X2 [Manihot esculenta]OAY40635.1 hypothetical protein MANES_09G037500v8 [Manihot esculenta]OAY40636.1 hypothetical protein MANES_09G037500v8 [Manihot esculenta]
MPGIAQRNEQFSNASSGVYSLSANGFWSKHSGDVSYNQLQKFWSELSPQARQKLLQIDKQTLFEQARKNMYCSRCNGLLLEGFLQIVMYGKSLQQEGVGGHLSSNRPGASENQNDGESNIMNGCQDEIQDPSVHPWGGLTTTRDGSLTLLTCYINLKSLKGLQNVFDSARARERERELLYPDACGGGGRGWISQGMASYGRGHGIRETCALHTARLSCDTLVDFWSALGEETRQSLLRMKEEDFIERLMYRFDSKRFCRDCRRNVIREFKELKELKRMRREPRCTSWFCVADTAFQYEVSDDKIQADWHQTFADTVGSYHHFEWAVGTGEGKSDILEFENVGMNGSVQVNGLDLGGLTACFITLRAWKLDGRCTELSVKAHALRGQQCVHCRLVVGDGFVTITRGESIRSFFEHAEEAEEEEDDDSMDKDGNELDGECSRPQKHAKSPELAREFLLDAATVIFKEQVEKAFREGTARQNAHSIFVCLALKLLEERVHVACKEIITLEKQMKLLEEEEKEKREEEERKERRRTKEREKKLRRKERLKGKERDKEKKCSESNNSLEVSKDETSASIDEEANNDVSCRDSVSETGDICLSRPESPDVQEKCSNGYASSEMQNNSCGSPDGGVTNVKDGTGSFMIEQSKFSYRRLKFRKEVPIEPSLKRSDRRRFAIVSENGATVNRSESRHYGDNFETPPRGVTGLNRQSRINRQKSNGRNCGLKFNEKFHCLNNRMDDRYDFHSCSCHQNNEYRVKVEPHVSAVRIGRDSKFGKSASTMEASKKFYCGNKYGQINYMREGCVRAKSKSFTANNSSSRDLLHPKKVWEPTESHKKYAWSNSDSDVTLRSATLKVEELESDNSLFKTPDDECSGEVTGNFGEIDEEEHNMGESGRSNLRINKGCLNGHSVEVKAPCYSTKTSYEEISSCRPQNSGSSGTSDPSIGSISNSDNCSSCLSEVDSNTASSNQGNLESSSTSDSEDTCQQSEVRESSLCQNGFPNSHKVAMEKKQIMNGGGEFGSRELFGLPADGLRMNALGNLPTKTVQLQNTDTRIGLQHQGMFPPMQNHNLQFPVFQSPSMNYYHQNPVAWPAAPPNGLMPFPHANHYLYAGPLSYGLNRNSQLHMQYSPVQHLATPIFHPGPVPVYQPVGKTNGLNSEEQTKMYAGQETLTEARTDKKESARSCSTEVLPSGAVGKVDNSSKLHVSNTSFSLFHFDGPVALSTGCKPDHEPSKDEIVGDLSSKFSTDQVDNDPGCNKKDTTMEEYNLFAASNGIRFSFF